MEEIPESETLVQRCAKAMQESNAWAAVFDANSAAELARAVLAEVQAYLVEMASVSVDHGYVDASSPHAAYRQGVEEASASIGGQLWL